MERKKDQPHFVKQECGGRKQPRQYVVKMVVKVKGRPLSINQQMYRSHDEHERENLQTRGGVI